MADVKTTKKNATSVSTFLSGIANEQQRRDSKHLAKLMRQVTGHAPKIWGSSIVGFGEYHYKYASGREGDWPLTGFSPRKQNMTVYIMNGFERYPDLMKKLGTYTTGKGCLYFKKLDDLDPATLRALLQKSVKYLRAKYGRKGRR